MKVILQVEVKNLGSPGQIVEVADGYARNYLIPRGLVVEATKSNLKKLEEEKRKSELQEKHERENAQQLIHKIEGLTLQLLRKASEDNKLFGSVTAQDLAEALNQQGIDIDKRKIELAEPIKSLGEFLVPIRLHREITTNLKVLVNVETPEKETEKKTTPRSAGRRKKKTSPEKES